MKRNLIATALIVAAVSACGTWSAPSPSERPSPTSVTGSPAASGPPSGAVQVPAEIVTAFCDYLDGYLAIVQDDPTRDALDLARSGDPGEWVSWAGPALVATAEGLGERLGDIVWWGESGTPAPRTAFKSLDAWTKALEASLKDPGVQAQYELIWKTWYEYTRDHVDLLRNPGVLKGSCG